MYKLNAHVPMVWRTPSSVQFGIDVAHVVIDPTTLSQEKAIAFLKSGFSEASLDAVVSQCGSTRDEFLQLLDVLEPALVHDTSRSDSEKVTIVLSGMGFVVENVVTAMNLLPRPPQVKIIDPANREQMTSFEKSFNVPTQVRTRSRPSQAGRIQAAFVFATFLLNPEDVAIWLRNDVPHIPIVFSDKEIRIGPVLGGATHPCAQCLFMHATDKDSTWPAIATQLLGKTAPTCTPYSLQIISALLAQLVSGFDQPVPPPKEPGLWLDLSNNTVIHFLPETGELTRTALPQHPDCACRMLPTNFVENKRNFTVTKRN